MLHVLSAHALELAPTPTAAQSWFPPAPPLSGWETPHGFQLPGPTFPVGPRLLVTLSAHTHVPCVEWFP